MANRRPFGSVFRRHLPGVGPGGKPRYAPGWYVRVRRAGRETRRYAGPDRETALDYLQTLRRQLDREELLGEVVQSNLTFAEFAPQYLAHAEREQTAESYETLKRMVPNGLVPFFGALRLRDITKVHIERFLGTRAEVTGATRNRLLSTLRGIFRYANDLHIVKHNPAREIRRSSEPQTPLPFVPIADQLRMLEILVDPYRFFVLTALETGMRRGELLRLEWQDVDLVTGTLHVRETKGKRPRLLVLSRRLREALVEAGGRRCRPLRGPDPVFPGARAPGGSFSCTWAKAFKTAARAIGHPHLRIHDLRHITAINLVRAGLDLPTIQAFLGHRSLATTLRYACYADETAASRAAHYLDLIYAPAEGVDVSAAR